MVSANNSCANCNIAAKFNCTHCKVTFYCGTECQRKDWPMHKLICRKYVTFITENPRPQSNDFTDYILSLRFPANSKQLELFWMPVHKDGPFWGPETRAYLDVNTGATRIDMYEAMKKFGFIRQPLRMGYIPVLYVRDTYLRDGSKLNISINAITSGQHKHPWSGPVLLFKEACHEQHVLGLDFQPNDLSFSRVFFLLCGLGADKALLLASTGNKALDELVDSMPNAFQKMSVSLDDSVIDMKSAESELTTTVKAVYLSCKGDRKILLKPKYNGVDIKRNDIIFRVEAPTGISRHMGLPLLTLKPERMDPKLLNKQFVLPTRGYSPYTNRKALYMNLRVDPKNRTTWSWADIMKWDIEIGTVLVARQDKKDITPHQVEAIAEWCQYVVGPALEEKAEKEYYMSNKKALRSRQKSTQTIMGKAMFEKFFVKFKDQKIKAGDSSWKDEMSPYST